MYCNWSKSSLVLKLCSIWNMNRFNNVRADLLDSDWIMYKNYDTENLTVVKLIFWPRHFVSQGNQRREPSFAETGLLYCYTVHYSTVYNGSSRLKGYGNGAGLKPMEARNFLEFDVWILVSHGTYLSLDNKRVPWQQNILASNKIDWSVHLSLSLCSKFTVFEGTTWWCMWNNCLRTWDWWFWNWSLPLGKGLTWLGLDPLRFKPRY